MRFELDNVAHPIFGVYDSLVARDIRVVEFHIEHAFAVGIFTAFDKCVLGVLGELELALQARFCCARELEKVVGFAAVVRAFDSLDCYLDCFFHIVSFALIA